MATVRLPINLTDIYQRLNEHASLKGRFIVLPNVNDGGEDTILRHAFQQHYKAMPCVGGYVDGTYDGHGRRSIVEGRDSAWGRKSIGVLQTSDSRSYDCAKLGAHPTWIKWSIPSAEALRQACLAPASRLRHATPALPFSYVSRLRLTASSHLGAIDLTLSPQVQDLGLGHGRKFTEDVAAVREPPQRRRCGADPRPSVQDGSRMVHAVIAGRSIKGGSRVLLAGQGREWPPCPAQWMNQFTAVLPRARRARRAAAAPANSRRAKEPGSGAAVASFNARLSRTKPPSPPTPSNSR